MAESIGQKLTHKVRVVCKKVRSYEVNDDKSILVSAVKFRCYELYIESIVTSSIVGKVSNTLEAAGESI